jgi:hypothetical protein
MIDTRGGSTSSNGPQDGLSWELQQARSTTSYDLIEPRLPE